MILPDMLILLYRILKDKRVNVKTKAITGAIIAYLTFPKDIIPDHIPFIGKIDDAAVALLGIDTILNNIPKDILLESWEGNDDVILIIKTGVGFISHKMVNNNVYKIVRLIQ